jgi:hypothetical protein
MARYTCSVIVQLSLEQLQISLIEMLKSCNLDILYDSSDYVMAREKPGKVSFAKLVTVEVLIDRTTATEEGVKMHFVVKNEELPLQVENHCKKIFDIVQQAIVSDRQWQIIENMAG